MEAAYFLAVLKDGNRKYCNKRCYEADEISRVAGEIPDEVMDEFSKQIHGGICLKCNGPGPVDIHKSYSVYSVILYTAWRTKEHLLCKKCASRQQIEPTGALKHRSRLVLAAQQMEDA